jgi:hypothetical protein
MWLQGLPPRPHTYPSPPRKRTCKETDSSARNSSKIFPPLAFPVLDPQVCPLDVHLRRFWTHHRFMGLNLTTSAPEPPLRPTYHATSLVPVPQPPMATSVPLTKTALTLLNKAAHFLTLQEAPVTTLQRVVPGRSPRFRISTKTHFSQVAAAPLQTFHIPLPSHLFLMLLHGHASILVRSSTFPCPPKWQRTCGFHVLGPRLRPTLPTSSMLCALSPSLSTSTRDPKQFMHIHKATCAKKAICSPLLGSRLSTQLLHVKVRDAHGLRANMVCAARITSQIVKNPQQGREVQELKWHMSKTMRSALDRTWAPKKDRNCQTSKKGP